MDDTQDYHTRQEAQVTRIKFDKKIYKLYKSAEVHTVKPRIPKQFWYFVLAILGTGTAGAFAFVSIMDRQKLPDQVPPESSEFRPDQYKPITLGSHNSKGGPDQIVTVQDYADHWTPRIPDIPHSAPAYDQVLEVKTYPRPQCVRHEKTGNCKCFTQQATPLDISPAHCNSMVDNGWFNPFRDESEKEGNGGGLAQRPAPSSTLPIHDENIVITDSDQPIPAQASATPPASYRHDYRAF